MIYFTSDLHFCHDREFVYKPRGFDNIDEMNEAIVQRWNSVVHPEDTVYVLGDLMLNNNDKGMELINRLNGSIIIFRGNHDTDARIQRYINDPKLQKTNMCIAYADVIKYGKYHFYMSHYPTMTSNLDNDAPLSQHIINLFGHTHQKSNFYNDIPFMYHVGLDSHDCYPVSVEQVLEDIRAKVQECKDML